MSGVRGVRGGGGVGGWGDGTFVRTSAARAPDEARITSRKGGLEYFWGLG